MLNLSEKTFQFLRKTSFDYKPLETEYTNSNISLDKIISKNFLHSFKNEKLENTEHSSINVDIQIMKLPIEINKIKDKLKIKNSNSNSIDSLNLSNSIIATPQRYLNKPKNIEFIPDVFNSSSTQNKKIMVSDLDISLETPTSKTQRKRPNLLINNNKDNDDFKKKLERNLLNYFEKNKTKLNNFPSTENRNELKQKFYTDNNYNNKNNNNIVKTEKKIKIEKRDNNNLLLTSPTNYLCLTIMNASSLKPPTKHKAIYKTGQKSNNNKKVNAYQIVKDITEKQFNNSLKNKKIQRVNSSKLKSKSTKKSLISNNSLTNCSSTCTHKGSNFPIYYSINSEINNINEGKKNIPKSVVKNQIKPLNYKNQPNQIFKTFSLENHGKEKLFYNPINIKRINNNNNSYSKERNNKNLQKEKINFIQNVYDSSIGNSKKKNVLPEKYIQLMSSQSKNKISKDEKIKKNIKIDHKKHNNIPYNKISLNSLTFKMFDKKISKKKSINNKRLETENSLIERGKTLSEKYTLLLKQSKKK